MLASPSLTPGSGMSSASGKKLSRYDSASASAASTAQSVSCLVVIFIGSSPCVSPAAVRGGKHGYFHTDRALCALSRDQVVVGVRAGEGDDDMRRQANDALPRAGDLPRMHAVLRGTVGGHDAHTHGLRL